MHAGDEGQLARVDARCGRQWRGCGVGASIGLHPDTPRSPASAAGNYRRQVLRMNHIAIADADADSEVLRRTKAFDDPVGPFGEIGCEMDGQLIGARRFLAFYESRGFATGERVPSAPI